MGRLGPDGPWVGFAPTLDDGYALVVGDWRHGGPLRCRSRRPRLRWRCAYFEEALEAAPEDLAATHADIGSLVRHLAAAERRADVRRRLVEAVDAVDDGLAADVVVGRLTACLEGEEEPIARLERRATEVLGA